MAGAGAAETVCSEPELEPEPSKNGAAPAPKKDTIVVKRQQRNNKKKQANKKPAYIFHQ